MVECDSHAERGADHRFAIQHLSEAAWRRATEVNAGADYLAGHRSIVEAFIRQDPAFLVFGKYLRGWPRARLEEFVEAGKGESLAFLVMMLTGECNADCSICFTDRRRKDRELSPDERTEILRQARALGARYVYVPGEGEPTIDRGFWSFLQSCKEMGLEAVIFANGLVLSDRGLCRHYWKTDPEDAVRKLADYPVSFYVKFWSTKPRLVGQMMNIRADWYHYTEVDGVPVPAGLRLLLERFPRERVGIEVVVESGTPTKSSARLSRSPSGNGLRAS